MSLTTRVESPAETALTAFVYLVGCATSLYLIYFAYDLPYSRVEHGIVFLALSTVIYYSHVSLTTVRDYDYEAPVADNVAFVATVTWYLLVGLVGMAANAYVLANYDRLQYAVVQGFTQIDFVVAAVLLIIVTDITRRAYGNVFGLVILASLIYGVLGPYFPGILNHNGMSFQRVLRTSVLELTGLYGFILEVGTTWVAIFIIFAGILKGFGSIEFVKELSAELRNGLKTGVAHVAVIASMIMGSITGSSAANTATTGSFTIPMLKDQGVSAEYAGAIESLASSGGQIMPPVMGVAAFLMADILGVHYTEVILAGLLPAVLFYLAVAIGVHLVILKHGWTSESKPVDVSLRETVPLLRILVPLAVLLYYLISVGATPLRAGLYTILATILIAYVTPLLRRKISVASLVDVTKQLFDGLKTGAVDMAPLTAILGALGIIIGMIQFTGLTQKIAFQLLIISGGSLVVLLVFSMAASILFGMGMPTPAAYLLVAIVVAPSLVEFGLTDLSSHMFVFYFAMISAITPPIAIAVAVAAQISGANFLDTCYKAVRLGLPSALVPFAFVFNSSLIHWTFPGTIFSVVLVAVGLIAISTVLINYNGRNTFSLPTRVLFVALSMTILFYPSLPVKGVAALVFGAIAVPTAWLDRLTALGENVVRFR